MDPWPITIEARRSLLSTYEGLDEADWDVASLCEGWTIRQLLAHLILAARPPAREVPPRRRGARGSFDKANHSLAVLDATRPTSQLLQDYRGVLDHRRLSPPGWISQTAPLWDILLHTFDVRIPLGLETDEPADHFEPVVRLLFSRFGRSFITRGRPTVRWIATDHEWAHGSGPEVRGSMADLVLTTSGRSARVDHLDGDGLPLVRAWLSS